MKKDKQNYKFKSFNIHYLDQFKNLIFGEGDIMKQKIEKLTSGKILISEPFQNDFYFGRAVVLLAEHNKNGSFGVIINKPVEVKINELFKDFPTFNAPVYLGGPVRNDSIFYLHTLGTVIPESIKIMDGLYWGGNFEILKDLIEMKEVTEDQIKFYIGYTGWSANQLETELKKNYWVVSNSKLEEVMSKGSEKLWNESLKQLGNEYALWLNFPRDPSLN